MARASGREKSESGPAGRLFPAAFLRRPALGDGGPPASGTVVLVPRPAELLALVSPAVLASGTVRRSATSRSESGATARPGMRAMRSPLHRDPSTQVSLGAKSSEPVLSHQATWAPWIPLYLLTYFRMQASK